MIIYYSISISIENTDSIIYYCTYVYYSTMHAGATCYSKYYISMNTNTKSPGQPQATSHKTFYHCSNWDRCPPDPC